ncbi:hypothetical protein, partial [Aliikangiella sp. G2MR2-5]|uniref:hypothetical protein n=1 Tax=Aliikangiella sp. G2MR2-5 TaxID=2788943 RepID=UPI0018AB7D23
CMNEDYPVLLGNIFGVKHPIDLERLLSKHGVHSESNQYSLRISEYDYFKVEFDHGINQIFSDADTIEELINRARRISEILTLEQIQHGFEIYDDSGDILVAEFRYE